ncbi:MAG: class I SAM-dependent RNA methyltransferase [Dehalococcoidia bacterium]|nr:class I SAM-dependent RNA methyltransferase [Dehalococcoidia bacterium]
MPTKQKYQPAPPETLQLILEEMTPSGECVAHFDGHHALISKGLPGETVIAEVYTHRDGQRNGHVIKVVEPSKYREEPRCQYYGPCSGCQLQHVDYQHQLAIKMGFVASALKEAGLSTDVLAETIDCDDPWEYRNHARFTVRKGVLGFTNRFSHRFVQIDHCDLMHPWINDSLLKLQGKCSETTQLSLRYGTATGSWLIQPPMKSDEINVESGQIYYHESLLGNNFRIGSPSFFQVNTKQAEKMIGLLRQSLRLTDRDVLVDAYAGVGTFAVLLAPFSGQVIAIEESASAIKDACENIHGVDNVKLIEGKTEDVLGQLSVKPDAIIVDPSRVGCAPGTIAALLQFAVPRLAYVSCDPKSLARDLRLLTSGGYLLERVQPVDLFPHTYHIECIASLSWKGA